MSRHGSMEKMADTNKNQAGSRENLIGENARLSGDATLFLEKHKLALTMHTIMLTFQSPGDALCCCWSAFSIPDVHPWR